jgi:hypothetical protein
MPRLIDADRIVYSWIIDNDGEEHDGITLQSVIDKMPTIDAVPVVRCKDCENWVENEHCLAWAYEYSDANGFCYLGKRRGLIGTQMSLSERREDELLVTDKD